MANRTDENERPSRNIPQEKVDETEFYREFRVGEPRWREKTASRIAYIILVLFGACLTTSFSFAFYVLAHPPGGTADEKVVDLSMSYLKTVGAIFTPVLAFIMGYYFARKED